MCDLHRVAGSGFARVSFATLVVLAGAGRVGAQHEDVEFEVVDGRLVVGEAIAYSSLLLAPGELPQPGAPPTETDEPGFEAPDGALTPGATLGLRVVQPLHYWDGAAVANPAPLTTPFLLDNGGGSTIELDRSGVPAAAEFQFAVAGAEGGVHQHITFRLPEPTAPDGAYGVVIQLTSPGLGDSLPFLLVFGQRITGLELSTATDAILTASGISEGALAPDFNLDGAADDADFADWTAGFGAPTHALLNQGDADRNGRVDGDDFLAWQRGFAPLAPAVVAPEPTAAAIAASVVGPLAFRRRRRPQRP